MEIGSGNEAEGVKNMLKGGLQRKVGEDDSGVCSESSERGEEEGEEESGVVETKSEKARKKMKAKNPAQATLDPNQKRGLATLRSLGKQDFPVWTSFPDITRWFVI